MSDVNEKPIAPPVDEKPVAARAVEETVAARAVEEKPADCTLGSWALEERVSLAELNHMIHEHRADELRRETVGTPDGFAQMRARTARAAI